MVMLYNYQIKENWECSNIVANVLPAVSPTLGVQTVVQNSNFLKNDQGVYHKLMGITIAATWKQIFCHKTHSNPSLDSGGGFKG